MFKRKLFCSECSREIQGGEEIDVKMKAPKKAIVVEIKAYLKKNSEIICKNCTDKSK
ncbi:Fe3+ hydroxamate ABC transporter substrate-binding protein [Salimicrobium jeotgali]|uniref:Fe3+ hydroxamate ABC transporter substrate-binding protein n=1 Tax=Salimicrobium jeotgali TaxID=1230341 RepID=UPI000C8494A1|nr:Fe3+ hydroxamate ABC transporter substrate-binding protein [Salimicrobium jeotgali]